MVVQQCQEHNSGQERAKPGRKLQKTSTSLPMLCSSCPNEYKIKICKGDISSCRCMTVCFVILFIFMFLKRTVRRTRWRLRRIENYDDHKHGNQTQITAAVCKKDQTCPASPRSIPEDFQKYTFLDHNTDVQNQHFLGGKMKESVFFKGDSEWSERRCRVRLFATPCTIQSFDFSRL